MHACTKEAWTRWLPGQPAGNDDCMWSDQQSALLAMQRIRSPCIAKFWGLQHMTPATTRLTSSASAMLECFSTPPNPEFMLTEHPSCHLSPPPTVRLASNVKVAVLQMWVAPEELAQEHLGVSSRPRVIAMVVKLAVREG